MDAEKQQLQAQLEAMGLEKDHAQDTLENLAKEKANLQSTLEQLQQQIAEQHAVKEQVVNNQTDLDQQLQTIHAEKQKLQEQLEAMGKEKGHARCELKTVQETLRQTLEDFEAQKQSLESKTRMLSDDLQKAVAHSNDLTTQARQEQAKQQELRQTIHQLKEDLDAKSNDALDRSKTIDSLQQTIAENRTSEDLLPGLQETIARLENENRRLSDDQQASLDNAENLSNEIIELKDQVDDLKVATSQTQHIRNELKETETILSHERSAIRNLQAHLQSLEDKLATEEQDRRNVSEKLALAIDEKQQLQSEHDRLCNEFDSFRAQEDREISSLMQELNESRSQTQQVRDEFDQLRQEYDAYQVQAGGEVDILTDNKHLLEQEMNCLAEEVSRLKEQQQQVDLAFEKLTTAESNLKIAQEELADERHCTQDLRSDCEQFQAALDDIGREKDDLANALVQKESTEDQLQCEIDRLTESNELIQQELLDAQNEILSLKYENQEIQRHIDATMDSALAGSQEDFYEQDDVVDESRDAAVDPDTQIPTFNLADQIMEEQRRSVSNRRQRVSGTSTSAGAPLNNSVTHIVQQYVNTSTSSAAPTRNRQIGIQHHPWTDHSLTSFQQDILKEIVQKDLELYCRKQSYTQPGYPSMKN